MFRYDFHIERTSHRFLKKTSKVLALQPSGKKVARVLQTTIIREARSVREIFESQEKKASGMKKGR